MEVYYHRTDGGAEYLSTTFVECPNGYREGTFEGVFARVDGGELEIFTKRLEAQGIKLVINTRR